MELTMFKSKLHKAAVTQCDLNYEGSITIDQDFLEAADLLVHEQVDVLNINTGARFTTYTIPGERGSGIIGINGAAARLAQKGDRVIILSYARMDAVQAKSFEPTVVLLDEANRIVSQSDSEKVIKAA